MSRTVSSTIEQALAVSHGFRQLARLEVYPSRVFFNTLTSNNPTGNADDNPAGNDPVRQDIGFNTNLVTFFISGTTLKYMVAGSGTEVSTGITSTKKPGVYGNKIYVIVGEEVKRYSIDWTAISNLESSPLSLDATLTPTNTPMAAHGISETECVVFGDGDGGFSVHYFNGTIEILCNSRFMFPYSFDWQGIADTDPGYRSFESLATFSTGFKLGTRIFAYMSNSATGIVHGTFYDIPTESWSEIFSALPTDLETSLCEFRIANSFVRNGKGYLVGQFLRTDVYETALPHTLILSTSDGRYFSIDRFCMVSTLGYRFLGLVGSDNNLHLSNCNRVCSASSTWVFDGNDDSTSPVTIVPLEQIHNVTENEAERISIKLAAGNEQIFDNPHFSIGSRIKYYSGYHTSAGEEYILSSTLIIETEDRDFSNGKRSYTANCVNETQWKLTGKSMPFYAEIFGLSSMYDPMTEESGKLYAATSGLRTLTSFFVDFWNHEPYINADLSITGFTFAEGGACGWLEVPGAHKIGIITKEELTDMIGVAENPKITGTSITAKIYGWSIPSQIGAPNDKVDLILITCDAEGEDEKTLITTDNKRWEITYPYNAAGDEPIILTITGDGIEDGRRIKKIGLVFEQVNTTNVSPGRVEFTSGVEASFALASGNSPWTSEGDGTFKVPSPGQPFIMFAQKPYNAWNFSLTSLFSNTVEGGIVGYATAVGLVGLAQDASNYVLARYDRTSNKVQLVKCRNGIETQLDDATPGWTLGELQGLQFIHKDGHFEVNMFRESTSQFENVLTYEWIATDSFLYTSSVATKKTGIYGAMMSPTVRLLAFAGGSTESGSTLEGIPVDPLADTTDFPTSGNIRVGDTVYAYTEKIAHPAYIRGPHQLRAIDESFEPPYGNGKAGLQCLAFDFNENDAIYTGKLISIDNGPVFISAGSQWKVYNTTNRVRRYLYRSQHYSDNPMIGKITSTSANRVWPGIGGFGGISLVSGLLTRHSTGDFGMLDLSGEIKCYWFMGSGGETDTTISDLLKTIISLSGGSVQFPGNFTLASLAISGETDIFQDDYSEGFDLEFDLSGPASFEIRTNIKLTADNYEEVDDITADTGTKLVFSSLGSGNYAIALVCTPSGTQMYKFLYSTGSAAQHFRILYHENNISVYHNYRWVASITLDELIYTQTQYVDIKASGSITMQNVIVHDLSDWREAIYIDLETDGGSAIGSVIQERPIEAISNSDGSVSFFYEMTRPEVTALTEVYSYKKTMAFPSDGASDAIVYGSKDVLTIHYELFAESLGFATALYRFPNMGTGAIEATYRTLRRNYESQEQHTCVMRPDIRIMPGDILHVNFTLVGTGRVITESMIVESVSYSLSNSMTVTGRKCLEI